MTAAEHSLRKGKATGSIPVGSFFTRRCQRHDTQDSKPQTGAERGTRQGKERTERAESCAGLLPATAVRACRAQRRRRRRAREAEAVGLDWPILALACALSCCDAVMATTGRSMVRCSGAALWTSNAGRSFSASSPLHRSSSQPHSAHLPVRRNHHPTRGLWSAQRPRQRTVLYSTLYCSGVCAGADGVDMDSSLSCHSSSSSALHSSPCSSPSCSVAVSGLGERGMRLPLLRSCAPDCRSPPLLHRRLHR